MIRNVVTCAKGLLFFLNIWVLCVVLVVVLGNWQIFETKDDLSPPYDTSHLVVMRELKEEDQPLLFQPDKNPKTTAKPPTKNIIQQKQPPSPPAKKSQPVNPKSNEQDDRLDTMRHWCRKISPNIPDALLIPAAKLQRIIVDDKHKLLYCQMPGVALVDIKKILVYLSGSMKVKSHLAIPSSDIFSNKYDKQLRKLSEFSPSERKKRIREYYKIAFVREPLERLYSSYDNKFKAKWSTYFHLNFGAKIIKKYRKKPSATSLKKGSDVTFSEFVQYVVDQENNDQILNEHWQQFYKQCLPCSVPYDFLGKYETLNNDIDHVLKDLKVRDKFRGSLVSTNSTFSKTTLNLAYKTIPETNLRKLWKMYYPDYNIFSYAFPEVLKQLLVKSKDFNDY